MKKKSPSEKKKKNIYESKKKNYGFYIKKLGSFILFCSLLALMVGMPLYFRDGYAQIATNKYKFFMATAKYTAFIFGGFLLVFLASWGMNKEERKTYSCLKKLDIAFLAFILFVFLSFLFSPYKDNIVGSDYFFYEGAFYGARGWFMGFMTFLILVIFYFAITRFYQYTNVLWWFVIPVALFIFVWGNCNRYGIYPIEMEYGNEGYIASMGNINWFSGYVSVLMPLVAGLFIGAKRTWVKISLIIPLIISFNTVFLNGSDSLIVTFAVMAGVVFLIGLKSERVMCGFFGMMSIFWFSCLLIPVYDAKFTRNYHDALEDIFLKGNLSATMFAISFVLCLLMAIFVEMGKEFPKFVKKWLGLIFAVLACILVAAVIAVIAVNTKRGGTLPVIGENPWFIFNDTWGSNRGATFKNGWLNFKGMTFFEKLFGAGPDCFYFRLCDNKEAFEYATAKWGESRLTNAHNEIITLLVNIGILGTGCFIALNAFAISLFCKWGKKSPCIYSFALIIVAYLANNMFSFEQIINTPLYFLMLGIGGAAVVKESEKQGIY